MGLRLVSCCRWQQYFLAKVARTVGTAEPCRNFLDPLTLEFLFDIMASVEGSLQDRPLVFEPFHGSKQGLLNLIDLDIVIQCIDKLRWVSVDV